MQFGVRGEKKEEGEKAESKDQVQGLNETERNRQETDKRQQVKKWGTGRDVGKECPKRVRRKTVGQWRAQRGQGQPSQPHLATLMYYSEGTEDYLARNECLHSVPAGLLQRTHS